jgi:hypothetical protein
MHPTFVYQLHSAHCIVMQFSVCLNFVIFVISVVKDFGKKFAMARIPPPAREARALPGIRSIFRHF